MAVSGAEVKRLPTLKGDQARASDPVRHVWLSASAGTGKTQVLTARVFRLLLRGVDPCHVAPCHTANDPASPFSVIVSNGHVARFCSCGSVARP